jgi:general stress protein YciG
MARAGGAPNARALAIVKNCDRSKTITSESVRSAATTAKLLINLPVQPIDLPPKNPALAGTIESERGCPSLRLGRRQFMAKGSSTSNRGFASMDEERQREIASKGGRSVPAEKRSFSQDRELASEAGRKGGQASGGTRSSQE